VRSLWNCFGHYQRTERSATGLTIYFCPFYLRIALARRQADFSTTVVPSAILLFRYSALTFNSHRIHFDHEYANKVELHPGILSKLTVLNTIGPPEVLVNMSSHLIFGPIETVGCLVHGPLSATYMLENLRKQLGEGLIMKNFQYRALSPLYVGKPIKICAKKMAVVPTMDADVVESYEVWIENWEGGLSMSGTVEVVKAPKS